VCLDLVLVVFYHDAGREIRAHIYGYIAPVRHVQVMANVVGAGLCIALSPAIARLTTIRFTLLAPFLFMMITFAAFQSRQSLGDLVALFAIGLLGIFLRRFDWSRPAFLIGFVLSTQAENYSFQAFQIARSKFRIGTVTGLEYILSPIVIVLIIITVISIVIGIRQAKSIMSEGDVPVGGKRAPFIFLICVTVYFVTSYFNAAAITILTDRIFPMTISFVATIACLALMCFMAGSLHRDFPPGLLQAFVELPWPLGGI